MGDIVRLRPVDDSFSDPVMVWECGSCGEQEFYYCVSPDGAHYLQCCNCDKHHQPWIYD